MKRLFFLVFILLLLGVAPCFGTNYYIDVDCGTPGDGTTNTCNGDADDSWDTIDDISGVNPNDIVFFRNTGVWDGGAGNQILEVLGGVTYDGSTWGGGTRAKLNATGKQVRAVVMFRYDDATYDTVLKGFEIDGNDFEQTGVGIAYPSNLGALTGTTKKIENCVIHDCGNSTETGYNYGIIVGQDDGDTTSDVEIIDTTVYNIGRSAIGIYPSNDDNTTVVDTVLVRGCEVYNAGEKAVAGGYGIVTKNQVNNAIIEFNYLHDNNNGVGLSGIGIAGATGPTDVQIRYNIIAANGEGFYAMGSGAQSADVYGNIFYDNTKRGAYIESDVTGTVTFLFYNNTFRNNATSSGNGDVQFASNSATYSALEVKNNILYAVTPTYCLYDTDDDITAVANNLYHRASGDYVYKNGTTYDSTDIADFDANEQHGDPLFNNAAGPTGFTGTYGTNMRPNNIDFFIPSGDALENGADLGSHSAINLAGYAGSLIRDNYATWDIGAYEHNTLTITATDAAAAEESQATGTFRVSRADVTGELAVTIDLGGTAGSGDYDEDLSGLVVTILNTASYIDQTITPTDDSDTEGQENLTMTVVSATGYVVGSPSQAEILIEDNEATEGSLGLIVLGGGTGSFVRDSSGSGKIIR